MSYYSEKKVALSLSGHLHSGIAPTISNGVCYITCGALCEQPFSYSILTINDNTYEYNKFSLEE